MFFILLIVLTSCSKAKPFDVGISSECTKGKKVICAFLIDERYINANLPNCSQDERLKMMDRCLKRLKKISGK